MNQHPAEKREAERPAGFVRALWQCLWRTPDAHEGEPPTHAAVAAASIVIFGLLIGIKVVLLLLFGVPGHAFFYQGF